MSIEEEQILSIVGKLFRFSSSGDADDAMQMLFTLCSIHVLKCKVNIYVQCRCRKRDACMVVEEENFARIRALVTGSTSSGSKH